MAGVRDDREPFGEVLRRLRVSAGMTQEYLAQAAGVSADAVGALERGVRLSPRQDTARLLADALGLDDASRQLFMSAAAPRPRHRDPVSARARVRASAVRPSPPVPWTPMIGRDELVRQVRELLAAGPGRLVTLVGPGGVGKTRVALALAAGDPDTASWADLAALSDPVDVPYVVAEAVGLAAEPGFSPVDALVRWAGRARRLLVLDNCEHLVDVVADLVGRMLGGPDGVRVLATSRERLGVPGEQVVVVPPLRVPAPGRLDADADAVRLFADRASRAVPGFALADTLGHVTDVCRALDGLPLAIELAAARVGALTVQDLARDLARHLGARLDLLSARGVDPRHHTLRSVIDWSYDLMSNTDRLLFGRLHVFAGEFDLAAAAAVATDEKVPAARIAHLVALLADRSMLTGPGHTGVGRYRMLDTLRGYAASRLSPEELTRLRRRHAEYLVEVVERADEGLCGPDEATSAARFEFWLDDARAACIWARDAGEIDLAVRLVAGLARYAFWRMRLDVLGWGGSLIPLVEGHPGLPVAYASAAAEAWLGGRLAEGQDLASRGLTQAGGPVAFGAAVPLELALVAVFLAALGTAYDQAPAWPLRDLTPTDAPMVEGVQLATAVTFRDLTALTAPHTAARAVGLASESFVLADAGHAGAWPTAREAVAHARASGNATALAMARFSEAQAAADQAPAAALAALDEARAVADRVGCRLVSALALALGLSLRVRYGSRDAALALFAEALDAWRAAGNEQLLITFLGNLTVLLADTGHHVEAVEIAASLRHRAHINIASPMAQRIQSALADARTRVGAQRYDQAWSAGSQRDPDDTARWAQQLLAGLAEYA